MGPYGKKVMAHDNKVQKGAGTSYEEKMFLYSLIRLYDPERVLEIGVSAGHSSCWIAAAVADNANGSSVHVDNFSRKHGGAAPNPIKPRERLDASGLLDWATIVPSDSQAYLKKQDANSFDIIFVDGDHSYKGAIADIIEAVRVASKLVIVHDTDQSYRTVREACADAGVFVFIDAHRGMALINPEDVSHV